MDFGTSPAKKVCKACNQVIEKFNECVTIEGFVLHNKCFICAICDAPLKHGSCARDHGVSYVQAFAQRQAPLWFCPKDMMLGSGEKMQLLKSKSAGKK